MPWDELKPRRFAAIETDLDGTSCQTMEDHYKLYEGYAKKHAFKKAASAARSWVMVGYAAAGR